MAEVTMPRLSDTMQEGTIASWVKKPGEQVNKGDVIAQIETDKATMDLTAFESGTLQEILAPEGATVPIGQAVARIGNGASAPAPARAQPKPPAPAPARAQPKPPEPEPTRAQPEPPAAEPTRAQPERPRPEPVSAEGGAAEAAGDSGAGAPTGGPTVSSDDLRAAAPTGGSAGRGVESAPMADGRTRASPMARHIAAEHGLDLAAISGSGPQGRVIRADVEAALSSQAAAAAATRASEAPAGRPEPGEDDERVPLSQMRRTIARRMAESTRTIPHFFLTTVVDGAEMVKLRKQILDQTAAASDVKISFNDMILKGVALAIRKVPEVNVSFAEDNLIKHHRVHIGVAVATERGLIVPVIRDVDQKSLSTIAREARDLADRAHAGKLMPADYTGGTFTVSNLGMFGVEHFTAVINPPEAAILAVGAIAREPVEFEGQVVVRERMRLTLSVDHRALDGATGARYLQVLKELLEKPMLLLV